MNSTSSRYKNGNINVRFVSTSPLDLEIKYDMKPIQNKVNCSNRARPSRVSQEDASNSYHLNGKKNLPELTPLNRISAQLKNMEFFLEAPMARSVKLAADFTDWDRFPLDLIQSIDGVWWTIVPLLPGKYNYRFIVDGQWCDDPRAVQRAPNPFGTSNAVVQVT